MPQNKVMPAMAKKTMPVAQPRKREREAPAAVAAPSRRVVAANARKHQPPVLPESDEDDEDDAEEDDIEFDDVDEEEEAEDDDESENDDDDFERKAEKFKKKMRRDADLAQQELHDDIHGRAAKTTTLRDVEEEMEAADDAMGGERMLLGITPSHTTDELKERIKETVRVLTNFSAEREEGRTRDEYQSLLRTDLMGVYEYNSFLMDAVLDMFSPAEAVEFLEAMELPRPTTIRTNTIKCKRRDLVQVLTKKGVHVEPLEKWTKVGLQIFESNVPIAGTTEYLAGQYMLQSAVSFLPVMALAPAENERILDMSAAPGGKTTYIAQLMKNSGVLFANDVSEPRCKSLNANLQRLGVTNCIVTNYDGTGYDKVMKNFDRVLLDAPCTGTGIISRDKSIKLNKQREDVQRHGQLQRRLLLSAIDCCKVGGFVVYSTCSFMVEEDEAVVDFALRQRHVEVVDMGLAFGKPGFVKFRHQRFSAQLEHARRYFPHVHNMDGFFVCKLRKISDKHSPSGDAQKPKTSVDKSKVSRQDGTSAAVKQVPSVVATAGKKVAAAVITASSLKMSVPPKMVKNKKNAQPKKKGDKKKGKTVPPPSTPAPAPAAKKASKNSTKAPAKKAARKE